jgi:cell wall assembly regulator SMI1
MDRSVTDLLESGVQLPWWWVYGCRFESQEQAPKSRGVLSCHRVSDVLPGELARAERRLDETLAQEEALRKHREKYSAKTDRPAPSKSVIESWKRIEAWYAENANDLSNTLAPGASEATIERFEKEIGAELPLDFKESVRVHDGGGWWVPWRHGDLLSLEGILKQWKMYCDWQANGDYAGKDWIPQAIKGPIKPLFWNRRRIYITDNSGDHLTLDLDPPADGKYGQVLDHSHEVGPTEVVGSGWAGFLRQLVEDLETGKYVYLEREDSLELIEEVEKELADE